MNLRDAIEYAKAHPVRAMTLRTEPERYQINVLDGREHALMAWDAGWPDRDTWLDNVVANLQEYHPDAFGLEWEIAGYMPGNGPSALITRPD